MSSCPVGRTAVFLVFWREASFGRGFRRRGPTGGPGAEGLARGDQMAVQVWFLAEGEILPNTKNLTTQPNTQTQTPHTPQKPTPTPPNQKPPPKTHPPQHHTPPSPPYFFFPSPGVRPFRVTLPLPFFLVPSTFLFLGSTCLLGLFGPFLLLRPPSHRNYLFPVRFDLLHLYSSKIAALVLSVHYYRSLVRLLGLPNMFASFLAPTHYPFIPFPHRSPAQQHPFLPDCCLSLHVVYFAVFSTPFFPPRIHAVKP